MSNLKDDVLRKCKRKFPSTVFFSSCTINIDTDKHSSYILHLILLLNDNICTERKMSSGELCQTHPASLITLSTRNDTRQLYVVSEFAVNSRLWLIL